MPPDVAAVLHRHVAAGVLMADDELDAIDAGRVKLVHRRVHVGLERHCPPAALALVLRDHGLAERVLDPIGDRRRRESAEDHRMDRANPRAGQHRRHDLRRHPHVDRDPVALADAAATQLIRQPADLGVQFAVRNRLVVRRLVAFPQDRRLVAARLPGAGRDS